MNKQIDEKEEIKKIISDICPFYKEYGTCEQCNTAFDIDDPPCYWECMAREIVRNHYHKQSEGEWISVDERLPEEYETVLAYGEEIGVRMVFYAVDLRVWNEGVITHWMPLPNPPKMKGGE